MTISNDGKKINKSLRYAEYYDMTEIFDKLYADSLNDKKFNNLMNIIKSEENIKLAYRNIKRNAGSITAGVDGINIKQLEKIDTEKFVSKAQNKLAWYTPKAVKRVEIPKPNGGTRPLGIPTMWDRVIQQCILQVLDPICEAKFHERSNGFRPNKSAENAIAQCYKMIQQSQLHYVVDIDIKGFFDNVNHSKLIKQMWTLGIRDKQLISIIKQMLKAPIALPNGETICPDKGTPQGGILSPLLSNIVLNELDWWISSQWETIPTQKEYKIVVKPNGTESRTIAHKQLRKTTKLKEMYIVRYADDFKIFCRYRSDANNIFIAVKQWLMERLKLQISEEKSKVINLKKNYSEFLGFKLKAVKKGKKYAVQCHMSDDAVKRETQKLIRQIKIIQRPGNYKEEYKSISRYNSMVIGIHNYYQIATNINLDCSKIGRQISTITKNRLWQRMKKTSNEQEAIRNKYIMKKYGKSKQMRFVNNIPFVPIAYIQTRSPMYKKRSVNKYTPSGRDEIHKSLGVNMTILHKLMNIPVVGKSIEYADNRISLYSAQNGKCAVTGTVLNFEDIHCHHKIPLRLKGTDRYDNLVIVHQKVHKLIHMKNIDKIRQYLEDLNLTQTMLNKLNKLRLLAEMTAI